MEQDIFCKIISKAIPTDFIYENDEVVAFKDINPKAPVHILIVPKKHIESVADLKEEDAHLVLKLILTAKKLAEEQGIAEAGYRLQFNVRRGGGQLVDHIHLHLLGGKQME